jgi:hypothetical protein
MDKNNHYDESVIAQGLSESQKAIAFESESRGGKSELNFI